jgi:hypothetical protein
MINAFTGEEVATGGLAPNYAAWTVGRPALEERQLLPPPIDPAQWQDERIGWGVILADREGLSAAALATADDAPEPIRALVAARNGKVLRYRPGSQFNTWTLRDYVGQGDLLTAASPPGAGPRQLPMYLLIHGSPAVIPWQVQYALNPVRHVGRLDLTGDALANYVGALLDDWSQSQARYDAPVVWSVDHGGGDITTTMRDAIGAPMFAKLAADSDITGGLFLDGSHEQATVPALTRALTANQPALVITTSHGMTGPLDDTEAMRANLGLLVDQAHALVRPEGLLGSWQPDGAIWFAQACCSVGSDQPSAYDGLFSPASLVGRVLSGVASLGASIAPLPRALLGEPKPLRAFIGQVEPTFNWTIAFPPNQQQLTADLQNALYQRLCSGQPVGLAMNGYYQPIGSLLINHNRALTTFNVTAGEAAQSALDLALYSKVTAFDRASVIILGDPTVAIPTPA